MAETQGDGLEAVFEDEGNLGKADAANVGEVIGESAVDVKTLDAIASAQALQEQLEDFLPCTLYVPTTAHFSIGTIHSAGSSGLAPCGGTAPPICRSRQRSGPLTP